MDRRQMNALAAPLLVILMINKQGKTEPSLINSKRSSSASICSNINSGKERSETLPFPAAFVPLREGSDTRR